VNSTWPRSARNIDQFARHFADDPLVKIPKVYWEFTNDRVNVQDEIVGMGGRGTGQAACQRTRSKLLAARGADTVLRMVLVHGYFHADPHPGNVLFLPGNRIGMIDFGMVGMLTHPRRQPDCRSAACADAQGRTGPAAGAARLEWRVGAG